jgi:hypothetical protein
LIFHGCGRHNRYPTAASACGEGLKIVWTSEVASTGDISVKAIQTRGAVFWQCNVALGLVAQQLATAFQMPVAEVRADLIAGLNPDVRLMPSHVMALALAQERGFTYMKP